MASESIGDSINDAEIVLASGRDVRTNGTECLCAGLRAKGAGDFLFEFNHTHVAFSLIVIKRNPEVAHESEPLRFVSMESVQEVPGFGLFGSASCGVRLSWGRIGSEACVENLIVSSFKAGKCSDIKTGSLGMRILGDVGDRLLDIEQQGLHLVCPRLVVLLMGKLEFT